MPFGLYMRRVNGPTNWKTSACSDSKTLAQLRQFQLTSKLIDDYKTVLPRPSFYSDWVTGQYLYFVAEKSGDAADYHAAANRLQLAVQQETGIPIIDVERCRNKLGWAYYKAGRYQKAADCFELVFGRIARLEPSVAASAAWLQHDCYPQAIRWQTTASRSRA